MTTQPHPFRYVHDPAARERLMDPEQVRDAYAVAGIKGAEPGRWAKGVREGHADTWYRAAPSWAEAAGTGRPGSNTRDGTKGSL